MAINDKAMTEFQKWYDSLPRPRATGSAPAKGSIAIGLVLLERLKTSFDLSLESHLAPGGAQIQGASGVAVKAILAAFGETRRFVGEGGRTNRGTPAVAQSLLQAMAAADLAELSGTERAEVLSYLQGILVQRVREFHSRERLKPVFDRAKTTRQFMSELLAIADETGKRGPVAQYLVGAKLQLRFPSVDIRNESYSAADDPSGQPGDFVVADTIFHVTVAPTPGHFEKCKRNLDDGLRVFLLVPDSVLEGARQNANLAAPGRIAVESIESFVGQNVDELANFSQNRLVRGLRALIEAYNARVDAVEIDKSMLVEIPRNLFGDGGLS
ncbi:MAG TPA: DUF4928 family protein [Pirellulales bacterium]